MSKGRRPSPAPSQDHIEAIVQAVAMHQKVSAHAIRHGTDRVFSSPARHEVWLRLKQEGFTYAAIARAWPCHHTTVLLALGALQPRPPYLTKRQRWEAERAALRQLSTEHTDTCVPTERCRSKDVRTVAV